MKTSLFLPLLPMAAMALGQLTTAQQLPPVPFPPENPLTEQKRVLGKILFWDEQLSSDDTMACGTCHIMRAAGTDPRLGSNPGFDLSFGSPDDVVGSPGIIQSDSNNDYLPSSEFDLNRQVTGRNAPSAVNAQFARDLFWDGRAGNRFLNPDDGSLSIRNGGALENQVVGPPLSAVEMGHGGRDWAEITAKLAQVTPLRLANNIPADMALAVDNAGDYPALFAGAFGTEDITAERIAFAVATYERTLLADQTPFDAFMAGNPTAMTPAQQRGFNFLANQTVCFNCHRPPLFTDNRFHNIGLRPASEDIGRQAVTGAGRDFGSFKTPSLRNIKLRTSLMHVGWITDTRDALAFYNSNQVNNGHMQFPQNQSPIPTGTPGVTADFADIFLPPNVIPDIVDFLDNALLDPRLEAESFPFDRPTLHSEQLAPNPQLYGNASGPVAPHAIANSPLHDQAPDFKVGLRDADGGSLGILAVSLNPALLGSRIGSVELNVDLSPGQLLSTFVRPVLGSGTDGFASVKAPIGLGLTGMHFFGQWFVLNGTPGGLSASEGVHWIAR